MRNFLYSLAIFMMLIVMHCTIYRDMTLSVASLCILLARPAIAMATCVFIVLNACGYNCKLDCDDLPWSSWLLFFFILHHRFSESRSLIKVLRQNQQADVCNLSAQPDRFWRDVWIAREWRQCRSTALLCDDDWSRSRHVSTRDRLYAALWDSILQAVEWDYAGIKAATKHNTSSKWKKESVKRRLVSLSAERVKLWFFFSIERMQLFFISLFFRGFFKCLFNYPGAWTMLTRGQWQFYLFIFSLFHTLTEIVS